MVLQLAAVVVHTCADMHVTSDLVEQGRLTGKGGHHGAHVACDSNQLGVRGYAPGRCYAQGHTD
jgi:hypothetical protein